MLFRYPGGIEVPLEENTDVDEERRRQEAGQSASEVNGKGVDGVVNWLQKSRIKIIIGINI